nr:reverse transcriptase domain-containing protein [Tanacetum cinerariifolium]
MTARRDTSAGRDTKDPDRRKREARNLVRCYVTCSSERQREIEREWDAADRADHEKSTQNEDPVEIHHIKQKKGELTEAFMERFKTESMHVKRAPKYMRVYGFIHGITNPDLIKRPNDKIPKSVDEMMSVTTTFLRGEVVVVDQPRKKGPSS